ncbi:unnamed protein product [Protopolystoma xenopodis]|uniref:Uncharacterized protein n=1 Tax=Protopolystoma xenopodis TaxID=117903 RepID=A0A3S5CGJ7_9PLAT|nr:unnamed protein product [Protopolystoma xenopodis]
MTTTIVGHQPTPHRTYRTLWEPVNGSEQNMESSITRSQALLAVCTNYCPNPEYRRVRPFLLPTKSSFDGNGNPHSHLEKSLGYGAFGVVW